MEDATDIFQVIILFKCFQNIDDIQGFVVYSTLTRKASCCNG